MSVTFVVGDLPQQRVDAIVNAANEALAPGGGVCGAIHRIGGDVIFDEAARLGGCATGDAKATGAGRLPARFVIHAVGPVWSGGEAGEPELLASAYRRSLEVAEEVGCRTIAFPALSTGIYGYPPDLAAPVAVAAVKELETRFDEVRFVFLADEMRELYERAAIEPTLPDRGEHVDVHCDTPQASRATHTTEEERLDPGNGKNRGFRALLEYLFDQRR